MNQVKCDKIKQITYEGSEITQLEHFQILI